MRYKRVVILFFLGLFFTTNLWAITAPFIDDMEGSDDNGWTLDPLDPPGPPDTNDWERGEPSGSGVPSPYPPSLPLIHPSRTKCWGTNLSGQYTKNRTSILTSPQIDFVSAPKPFLSFYTWYAIAAGDNATFEVRTVGSPTWNVLESINPSSSGGWIKKTYNLSPYTGINYTGSIQVRFTLTSDNNNATRDLGLYIDDVAVGTNYDTQNRYIIAIEPELTPVSTATVQIEARDLFKFIDNSLDGSEVIITRVEDNPNGSLTQVSSPPVLLSGGKAIFTFKDSEREGVTFTPSVSGLSLTSVYTTGRFLSPFIKVWEEKE